MNLIIFGANGAIGKIVMSQAIENGDSITAYVRKHNSIEKSYNKLSIIEGDLANTVLIEKAIEKADVIISALGRTFFRLFQKVERHSNCRWASEYC